MTRCVSPGVGGAVTSASDDSSGGDGASGRGEALSVSKLGGETLLPYILAILSFLPRASSAALGRDSVPLSLALHNA